MRGWKSLQLDFSISVSTHAYIFGLTLLYVSHCTFLNSAFVHKIYLSSMHFYSTFDTFRCPCQFWKWTTSSFQYDIGLLALWMFLFCFFFVCLFYNHIFLQSKKGFLSTFGGQCGIYLQLAEMHGLYHRWGLLSHKGSQCLLSSADVATTVCRWCR